THQSRKRSPSWLQRHGHGRFVTLLDRQGNLIWAGDDQPMDLPSEMPLANFGPAYIGEYRVAQREVSDGEGRPLLVRVGIPRTVLDEDIRRVDFLAMEVATIALFVSLPLGYWLARRV